VPELIRVSEGTGSVLGLWDRKMEAPPTTAYLMTYYEGRCSANCRFCPQARESESDLEKLSRVSWPEVDYGDFLDALESNQEDFERVCIQTTNRPRVLGDLVEVIRGVSDISGLPISVSSHPLDEEDIGKLSRAGMDRFCVPIDGATPEIFERVKGVAAGGPYTWENHMRTLEKSVNLLNGKVTTHLIIGLGETERDAVKLIQQLHDSGITVGLFAFTPIPGTALESRDSPSLNKYRSIQIARHFIVKGVTDYSEMEFENGDISDFGMSDEKVLKEIESGEPFKTSGCPGCNRPFYNESPSGPIYNYPFELEESELKKVFKQAGLRNLDGC